MTTPTKDTLTQLHEAVAELNTRADEAGKRIKAAEAVFQKMGVGLDEVLPVPFFQQLHLAYLGGHLAVWSRDSDEVEPKVLPLAEASRLIRIHAARHIDDLIAQLLSRAKIQLATIRAEVPRVEEAISASEVSQRD